MRGATSFWRTLGAIFMASKLTRKHWMDILTDDTISFPEDIRLFQTIYSFEGHKAYASQAARVLGLPSHGPLNFQLARLAKRIAVNYSIELTRRRNGKYKYWDLFFNGWDEGRFWVWQMKPSLAEAFADANLDATIPFPEELPVQYLATLSEGVMRTVTVNSFERNAQARAVCINHWGAKCFVCGFDFQERYGDLGKGFIHVHHLIPISKIRKAYQVDPVNDLRPVCPNCHAMLHSQAEPLTIEELKNVIESNEHHHKNCD